jgi:hypothetical protein
MKKRAFWFVSLVSALAAVFLHWDAMIKGSYGVHDISLSANGDIPEVQRQASLVEAHQFYKKANALRYAGMAVAALSIVFLFLSRRKGEPTLRWPIIVVLAFYLLLQFGTV